MSNTDPVTINSRPLLTNIGYSGKWVMAGKYKRKGLDMEDLSVRGFKASGIAAGINDPDRKDLGLIYSRIPAAAAAVFTNNRVKAAPVVIGMERIQTGLCQAVIVNSGNANCCTGSRGIEDAGKMTGLAASHLGISDDQVQVASTGVIGKPLPMNRISSSMQTLVDSLGEGGFGDFAQAILTTDTAPKVVARKGRVQEKDFSMIGIAKGSGMICPDMATMLCFVISDVKASPNFLHQTLVASVNKSFHCITVDGDTSTNDTVLIMANGISGAEIKTQNERAYFMDLLDQVLLELAKMIVRDGEGATKFVEIAVHGAGSDQDARVIAETVAHSNLVKTAIFGEDANWGRIIAAAGRAGAAFQPDLVNIHFDEVMMVKNGVGLGLEAEKKAAKVLGKNEFRILIDLNMAHGQARIYTCDFSLDYVRINADYRS